MLAEDLNFLPCNKKIYESWHPAYDWSQGNYSGSHPTVYLVTVTFQLFCKTLITLVYTLGCIHTQAARKPGQKSTFLETRENTSIALVMPFFNGTPNSGSSCAFCLVAKCTWFSAKKKKKVPYLSFFGVLIAL